MREFWTGLCGASVGAVCGSVLAIGAVAFVDLKIHGTENLERRITSAWFKPV